MATNSRRNLPPRDLPFLDRDGKVALDWYAYLQAHDGEHGGRGKDALLRSNEMTGASGIAGAAGYIEIVFDGAVRKVPFE